MKTVCTLSLLVAVSWTAPFSLVPCALAMTIPTVPVGDPGNPGDPRIAGPFGGVDYNYRIGTTEVTNAQYAAFLNAKASSDPLVLYNPNMDADARGGIQRSGGDGSYIYSVKNLMANKPVVHVSYFDALRFANWLHNGKGSGDTESGAYTLLGGTPEPTNWFTVTRNPGAVWFLASEDEWYKAAYYDPTIVDGDGNYWLYPTRSNTPPTRAKADNMGNIRNPGTNVVNYSLGADWNGVDGHLTTVGSAGPLSESYYGTNDQGGNVREWIETPNPASSLGQITRRGGSWFNPESHDRSTTRAQGSPRDELSYVGFRVATVPEPSTAVLAAIAISALTIGRYCRRRRSSASSAAARLQDSD